MLRSQDAKPIGTPPLYALMHRRQREAKNESTRQLRRTVGRSGWLLRPRAFERGAGASVDGGGSLGTNGTDVAAGRGGMDEADGTGSGEGEVTGWLQKKGIRVCV